MQKRLQVHRCLTLRSKVEMLVNGGEVPSSAIDEENRRTPFFLYVLSDDSGCVSADQFQVLSSQNRSVHSIVGNESQGGSVVSLQADQPDPMIDGTVRVLAEKGLSLEIERTPIDVGQDSLGYFGKEFHRHGPDEPLFIDGQEITQLGESPKFREERLPGHVVTAG